MASVSAVVRNQGGAIHGGTTGVLLERGGTVTNLAGSVIGASSGHGISVVNDGGSVANAGAISGGLIGVLLDSGGNVANGSTDGGATVATGAEISGGTYGLWIGGNVVNYAGSTIRGNGNAGVLIAGASGTVDNRGIIDGLEDGIRLESGGTVINRGIVRGGTTAGIALANGGTQEHLGGQIVAQRGSGVQAAGGAIIDSHATIEGAPNAVQARQGQRAGLEHRRLRHLVPERRAQARRLYRHVAAVRLVRQQGGRRRPADGRLWRQRLGHLRRDRLCVPVAWWMGGGAAGPARLREVRRR
ncbi:hypothetical protein D8I24_6084 [Cupriavidus necator H850]|nr:hypothetical protein D8I24_6084 [Cupriavidus necator H850]